MVHHVGFIYKIIQGTFINPRVVGNVSMPLLLKSFLKIHMNIADITSLIIVKLLRIYCYRCQSIFMSLSSLSVFNYIKKWL